MTPEDRDLLERIQDLLTAQIELSSAAQNDNDAPERAALQFALMRDSFTPTEMRLLLMILAASWAGYVINDPNIIHPETLIEGIVTKIGEDLEFYRSL